MPDIQFKRGEFLAFRATTKFHLGERQRDIWDGDEVEFDGQTLKYQGEAIGAPSIRGAIKAGWLVPVEDNVSRYIPKPANIEVRPAQAAGRERGSVLKIESIQDDEREVGNLKSHQDRRIASQEASRDRITYKDPDVGTSEDGQVIRSSFNKSAVQKQVVDQNTIVEDEDVSVASTSAPPLQSKKVEAQSEVSPEISVTRPRTPEEAEAMNRAILAAALAKPVPKPKDPNVAYGGARHDSLGDSAKGAKDGKFSLRASEDDQGGQVVSKIKTSALGVAVGAEGARVEAQKLDISKVSAQDVEAAVKPVGGGKRPDLPTLKPKVPASSNVKAKLVKASVEPQEEDFEHDIPQGTATQVTEGESLSDKSSGTTGDVTETRMGSELDELLPDAIVAGGKPPASIVGQNMDDFAWDKTIHWSKRVELAVKNYGDQPEIIKQIIATETPSVAKQIQSKLIRSGKSV